MLLRCAFQQLPGCYSGDGVLQGRKDGPVCYQLKFQFADDVFNAMFALVIPVGLRELLDRFPGVATSKVNGLIRDGNT